MQNNLVIVESPAKAKTIEKFLGEGYKVLSSYGHIRDLKQKAFSIDIKEHFKPIYEIPEDKKKLVAELKEEAAKADMVWLASDEDREGEAISWHLFEVLKLDPEKTRRIVFHEITKTAILKAIEHPRHINIDLVNAQQARRVLDRIVGFELSPVLWRKIKPALSAGRVQSVAVRLIVEREREINAFTCEASYKVVATFKDAEGAVIRATLGRRFKTKEEAQRFLEKCKDATFEIKDITTRPVKKSPAPPFTTSTLQQEAARKLGFTVAQTMMLAQRLYESGLITYMRTDSVNLSELALSSSRDAILSLMGERYVHTRQYATKTKGAQEAHEAIRPTYMSNESIEGSSQEVRLYELIWKRTLASQMADAELEKTTATISVSGCEDEFQAVGEVVTFDGFLKVYKESFDEEVEQEDATGLPKMEVGEVLQREEIAAVQRFSQAPARYTEASLVRKLEELGIGRPSTYAPTISTIQQRGYVEKGNKEGVKREYSLLKLTGKEIKETVQTEMSGSEKSKLIPTDVGCVVNDFLMQYFPKIMDYNFTASVEKEFDEVAEGEKKWTDLMEVFYENFHPLVETTLATKTEHKVGERMLGTDPKSGKPVSVKIGRFGPVVQIGSSDDEEKPRFAQLNKEHSLETITLEEALDLFK
jgi:DNA topoisomerase-1